MMKLPHTFRSLVGSRDWVGFPVIIKAIPLMLGEGKAHITNAKEFIRTLTFTKVQWEQHISDHMEPTSRE